MYNTKEGKSCVIYIRVSSERQVKGYSLDGQKHYLAECAERRGMTVLDTYVEEGKSGKSVEGRTEFQRMLDDIQSGKVHTDYVLVFKLSRFGRNARDVLNSLEFIMKYGVHLMCVEDGLDSSTSMGKMMITILGAVAELERENIIAQSLLGREEKAKSGGWNGGFAPYGYRLVKGDDKSKGKLETVPEEKAVVQLVFDMFLNRNMGYTAISGYLNRNGYTRPSAKNAIRPSYGEWSSDHIKRMLSNPVYKMRLEAMKRQAGRPPKENASPLATNLSKGRSDEELGELVGESKDQIRRYIRLTELVPEILQMVDERQIAFRPAVEVSYLTEEQQYTLLEAMEYNDATPSLAQAIKMKKYNQDGKLNSEVIQSIMEEEKPNQKEKPAFRDERITKLIPKTVPRGQETDFVVKALEFYNRHLQRNKAHER